VDIVIKDQVDKKWLPSAAIFFGGRQGKPPAQFQQKLLPIIHQGGFDFRLRKVTLLIR
jgi:hypothetical protein